MSEQDGVESRAEAIPEGPSSPEDVASAARSCSVILILAIALVLVGCAFGVATILR